MDIFTELVRNLTIVIILATVLELFLPNGKMRPFVQIIVGLFVMITILSPLISIVKGDWSQDLQVWAQHGDIGNLDGILAKGEEVTQSQMEAQLNSIAALAGKVEVINSKINFSESGQIEKIHLTLGSSVPQAGDADIKPVEIAIFNEKGGEGIETSGGNSTLEENNTATYQNIKEIVASFYGIKPELIEIETKN